MIISNNNFIDIFKEWADAKAPLINDFGYGPLSDWGNSRQLKYPCMWVTHQPTSTVVVQNKNLTPTHNFTIIFVDQINLQDNTQNENGNDSDNRIHIMSDTQQLAFDFINDTILTFNTFKIIAEPNIVLSPIEDETTDKVNGWSLDISFRTPYLNCTIPSITPNPTCQPAYISNSDNTFTLEAPSGIQTVLGDITVTINGEDFTTRPAAIDIDLTINGSLITNSDDSLTVQLQPEQNYEVPNTLRNLNGTLWLDVPSASFDNISLKDQSGNIVTPSNLTENEIEIFVEPLKDLSSFPIQTGQTNSLFPGDDGARQLGILSNFLQLNGNNSDWFFGHKRRFTGITGGYHNGTNYVTVNGSVTTKQIAFPETIVLDWATWNRSTGELCGWQYKTDLSSNITLSDAVLLCNNFTTLSFPTGWFMNNINFMYMLCHSGLAIPLSYAPFEDPLGFSQWSSTESKADTTRNKTLRADTDINTAPKNSNGARAFPSRIFNINEL